MARNIDFNEILDELRSLDPSDPGRWPLPVLAGAVVLWLVVLTAALLYFLVWSNESPDLDRYHHQEMSLRDEFRSKHAQAVNLGVYKQQLADIQRSFGALLRELPGKTEVPNLLVDISQTGLAAGLQEKLFQPGPEQKKDFYAELPIQIRLTGTYHQFGQFVSGIAALPRIVTLHDIDIRPLGGNGFDNLSLDVTAKTYRYLDEDEQAAANAPKQPARRGGR
ncbi:MAG TPA: type 4a pilus biogenesis protein PilO [Steroidobacteraceae bacterium]|nr:type 4a pilus biogenesis protein PilO [Steroidobacteraceae bacterium]